MTFDLLKEKNVCKENLMLIIKVPVQIVSELPPHVRNSVKLERDNFAGFIESRLSPQTKQEVGVSLFKVGSSW